jgi:superfamily II DNA or RNA helicase
MSYQLRDYQSDLLDRIDKAWFTGSRSILCQLPTGGGKTILFSTVVYQAIQNGLKCLILAHREELIKQAADKIEIITNDPVGIIKAGYPTNYDRDIQVASVQSLSRRLNNFPVG